MQACWSMLRFCFGVRNLHAPKEWLSETMFKDQGVFARAFLAVRVAITSMSGGERQS
jgi:hypothetical protein